MYSYPMIFVFIFLSGVFDSIFDYDKIDGNKNDKTCFCPFPFYFQPYMGGRHLHLFTKKIVPWEDEGQKQRTLGWRSSAYGTRPWLYFFNAALVPVGCVCGTASARPRKWSCFIPDGPKCIVVQYFF
jgi:hypothetical protein